MTDFLTTLAARTLGLAPIMQPAIASIFSPGLVVAGDGEMGGERESSGNSSLYQLATPDLPAISRLPLSQISTLAPEFNNIEFNNETGKTPISQNIEPIIESANAPTIQQPKSLPVQRLSEVEIKQSPPFQGGLGGSATSETQNMPSTQRNYYESSSTSEQQELPKELPIKSSQSNPNIPNATLPFATAPQPTQKNESQSPTLPAFNQQTQQSSATPILPLTQVEPLINQVQPDKIQPQISNQLENTSIETSSTTTSLPTQKSQSQSAPLSISNQQTQHITKSTLNLTNSQTFTPPSSVEPLINQVQPDKIQPQISNQLENTSIETSSTTTSLPNQKSQSQSAPLSISNQQTQHITKSTLPLTNSQTFTPPSSVEPLINHVQANEIPSLVPSQPELPINSNPRQQDIPTETSATPQIIQRKLDIISPPIPQQTSQPTPFSTSNQQVQKNITKSTSTLTRIQTVTPHSVEPLINQVQSDEIQTQAQRQDTLRETLIDNTISLSTSNEIRELDKEIKAKDVDDSKAKLSASPSFSLSPPSENVSTLQPSQRLTNVNTVVIKPLVDKIRDANIPEQTSFKSANLSQYFSQKLSQNFSQNTASKIQPVVLPQQLSVYPQFETQIESKKSGRTDKRGEAVPMQQAPTPTIQVTIGRIEVRINNQTPSQTPRTQPNKSEPKLSLQDYLKKRQGGN